MKSYDSAGNLNQAIREAKLPEQKRFLSHGSLFILIVAILTSLPFLIIGLGEVYEVRQTQQARVRTRGTVVDNVWQAFASGGAAYAPKVEFEIAGGEKVVFVDGTGAYPPDYDMGAQVDLIYNPEDPGEAQIVTWKRLWLVPTILISVGVMIVAAGASAAGLWSWVGRTRRR